MNGGNTSNLDRTKRILNEAPLAGNDLDTKVLNLLRSEYLRYLGQYRRIDLLMQQKYEDTFDEFVSRKIVRENKYSWNVESDAMEEEWNRQGAKNAKELSSCALYTQKEES